MARQDKFWAGVYSATLLFWLRDDSAGGVATAAFLDRRLTGVGRIGKLRGKLESRLGAWRERLNQVRAPNLNA